jgi:2-oxo-4-hydroxy-4-carboxy-5-ureidoimidazoline decarboxylase
MPTPPALGLDGFNGLTDRDMVHLLLEVCSSPRWAQQVSAGRPFAGADALLDRADRVLAELPLAEIDAAVAGHPRIGGRVDNAASAWEQAGLADADDTLRARLAAGNAAYEDKFGHVYLVCASGLSAAALLDVLTARLANDAATERRVMRSELAKINRLRLQRLLTAPRP